MEKNDSIIANNAKLKPITEIAKTLGLTEQDLNLYGAHKAKIKLSTLNRLRDNPLKGKLILVSAMTPTPKGEGKTTVTIGLTQALAKRGKKVAAALREPSLGPCFGIKGGAAGGGYSQVLPMEDINLHFTGDIHAVSAAHNLLASLIDNHLYFRKKPYIFSRDVFWKRVLDMNDRALREIATGLSKNGPIRETGFDITAASEIMAILCLSKSLSDVKEKISKILVGLSYDSQAPVFAQDMQVASAPACLLKDAIAPNLVQTLEHIPVFIHGGPFANIAQGANSIIATRLALQLNDFAVTEAGFAFDLGGEKFFNIVSRYGGFYPSAVVIVATCRAVDHHGGIHNLAKHVENVRSFGLDPVVAINRFPQDTDEELAKLQEQCDSIGVTSSVTEVWEKGGEGGLDLADKILNKMTKGPQSSADIHYTYDWSEPVVDKIKKIATTIYGAKDVYFDTKAKKDLELINRSPDTLAKLPICMAKTQNSLSDNPKLLGRPSNFILQVREIVISSGAGFLVPITGEIMRMPGMPKEPAAYNIDIDDEGRITGLF